MKAAAKPCANCARAETALHWGGVTTGCRGCFVRELARAPRRIREAAYASLLHETQRMSDVRELQAEIDEEVERAQRLAAASDSGGAAA